jgi:hypothetical protein
MMDRVEMPHCIVAFADALGTGASTNHDSTAATFLKRLQTATSGISARLGTLSHLHGISVRWFSDSILMSVPFTEGDNLRGIITELGFVQATFAVHGIFLRGAVTKGKHHHSDVIDYGPALVEATNLEKSAADAARIILSSELQFDVSQLAATGGDPPQVICDLSDGVYFLDFITPLDTAAQAYLRREIELQYRQLLPDSPQARKLAWVASFFNWRTLPKLSITFALDRCFEDVCTPQEKRKK